MLMRHSHHVWPKFRLHPKSNIGLPMLQESLHRKGRINRRKLMQRTLRQIFTDILSRSHCHRSEQDFHLRVLLQQTLNHRYNGGGFAHTRRMKPYQFPLRARQFRFTHALAHTVFGFLAFRCTKLKEKRNDRS